MRVKAQKGHPESWITVSPEMMGELLALPPKHPKNRKTGRFMAPRVFGYGSCPTGYNNRWKTICKRAGIQYPLIGLNPLISNWKINPNVRRRRSLEKRTVSTVPVDPTSFSWWLFSIWPRTQQADMDSSRNWSCAKGSIQLQQQRLGAGQTLICLCAFMRTQRRMRPMLGPVFV